MAKNWCDVCYKEFLIDMKKRIGKDKNVFIDTSRMTFRCLIPTFTHDGYGNPVVLVSNCKDKRWKSYSQEEWVRLRNAGEL